MAIRKSIKKTEHSARKKVTQVLQTARESLKLLETLEKETLGQANERLLAALEKMGVVTLHQIQSLEKRVAALEAKAEK